MSNFVVSSLPDYVQTNRDLILKNFALVGTATRRRISVRTGIKGTEALNYLDLAPVLQAGNNCGFSASGTATLTQRNIVTATIKVNMDICPETLRGKYAEYLISTSATPDACPFEQFIVEGITDELNKKIEKLIWQGDHTQSSDTNIKWIDGFIYQFDNDADVIDVSIAHGTAIYNAVLAVYAGMTEEALARGGEIYLSPANYRAFLLALVDKNFYHYSGPQDAAPDEFILPGTDVKVVKTPGLSGVNNKIVGTFAKNLVYGCDLESDSEEIKVWWSDDFDVYRLKVKWNSGVSYYFPAHVTLGTIANS